MSYSLPIQLLFLFLAVILFALLTGILHVTHLAGGYWLVVVR